jgi:iron-sulfur cluster repair protein YtfE (RIC family)
MNNRQTFNMVKVKHFKTLEQYVPIVARVHGKSHPEFYEVQKIFDVLAKKIKDSKSQVLELDQEFEKLREITKGYTVPDDVCESYEAVYNMLAELDKAYHT